MLYFTPVICLPDPPMSRPSPVHVSDASLPGVEGTSTPPRSPRPTRTGRFTRRREGCVKPCRVRAYYDRAVVILSSNFDSARPLMGQYL